MPRALRLCCAALAVAAAAAATAATAAPGRAGAADELPIYAGAPADVLGGHRVVAVAPLWVSDAWLVDAEDRGALEDEVVQQLRAAGCTVVPPREAGVIFEEARHKEGDFLDAKGKFVARRYQAVLRSTLTTIRARFGADRLVIIGLMSSDLTVYHGVAAWHGVEEPAIAPVVPDDDEVRTQVHGVSALSLGLWVHGADGQPLYHNAGGLRLVELVTHDGHVVPLPDADLLADAGRNARAVRLALAPLLAATPPPRAAPPPDAAPPTPAPRKRKGPARPGAPATLVGPRVGSRT